MSPKPISLTRFLIQEQHAGHINAASGHGPWPEGALQFGMFLKQLGNVEAG